MVKSKKSIGIVMVLALLIIFSNLILFSIFINFNFLPAYLDVDRKSNGNTLISSFSFSEIMKYPERMNNRIPVEENSTEHKIFEIDKNGNLIWEFIGLAHPHEIEQLPNGHILVADTGYDRVIEINYPNKEIIWEWKPENINWTKVNSQWNSSHYYNNPLKFEWSHLNDVDFKNYGHWNACLISIRNFDLIIELNYTAEMIDPYNPSNIIWYYGDYQNFTLLNHQHNPDYLTNGNIIVCDSENNRVLEINYSTKEVEWIYTKNLNWPRDADELLDGNLLITDSLHNRIFKLDKETKRILWTYSRDLINPYEADQLDNGNILIGNGIGGVVYEINPHGVEVWRYGISYLKSLVYLNIILGFLIISISMVFTFKKLMKENKRAKKIKRITILIIGFILILVGIYFMFSYTDYVILVFHLLFRSR